MPRFLSHFDGVLPTGLYPPIPITFFEFKDQAQGISFEAAIEIELHLMTRLLRAGYKAIHGVFPGTDEEARQLEIAADELDEEAKKRIADRQMAARMERLRQQTEALKRQTEALEKQKMAESKEDSPPQSPKGTLAPRDIDAVDANNRSVETSRPNPNLSEGRPLKNTSPINLGRPSTNANPNELGRTFSHASSIGTGGPSNTKNTPLEMSRPNINPFELGRPRTNTSPFDFAGSSKAKTSTSEMSRPNINPFELGRPRTNTSPIDSRGPPDTKSITREMSRPSTNPFELSRPFTNTTPTDFAGPSTGRSRLSISTNNPVDLGPSIRNTPAELSRLSTSNTNPFEPRRLIANTSPIEPPRPSYTDDVSQPRRRDSEPETYTGTLGAGLDISPLRTSSSSRALAIKDPKTKTNRTPTKTSRRTSFAVGDTIHEENENED